MQTIKFNKDIYQLACLQAAIAEFKGLADFTIKESGNYFQVRLEKIKPQQHDVLSDEFSNYVLGLHS